MSDDFLTQLSNIELERALLRALFVYPECLKLVDLNSEDLHDHRHRTVYDAMRGLDTDNQAIDIETTHNYLINHKQLESAGGFAYLLEITAGYGVLHEPQAYAQDLIELATRRRAFREGQNMLRAIMDRSKPVNDTINEYSVRLPKLVKVRGGAQHISVYASRHYDRIQEAIENPDEAQQRVMKTGYLDYDAAAGGVYLGELIIVYGKPGLGKTKWVHQLGSQLAKNGHPGTIFQMETAEEEIMNREFSREMKVSSECFETGILPDEIFPEYTHQVEVMSDPDFPLYMDFTGGWNTVTLRSELTRLKAEKGIKWFVLDYLKFLTDTFGKDETERENHISIQLKRICRDLDIAGIVIHSMNKEGMKSAAPEMEHGSGGAGISYDCDKAIFMIEHMPEEGFMRYDHYRTFVFRKSRRRLKFPVFHMDAKRDYPAFVDVTPPQHTNSNGHSKSPIPAISHQEIPDDNL